MDVRRYALPVLVGISLVGCSGDSLECGPGTREESGQCVADAGQVTVTQTITNTITDTVVVTDGELDGGWFNKPLVELDEIWDNGGVTGTNGGGESHMHISDVVFREAVDLHPDQVFQCSYTFGVYNASNPASHSVQMQGFRFLPRTGTRDPGCIHLVPDEDDADIIYATHHGNYDDGISFLSGYDLGTDGLTSTLLPVQLPMVQETGVSYEGLDFENGKIFVATHTGGLAVFHREPLDNSLVRDATYQGTLVNSWDVQVVGNVAYIGEDPGRLVILDVTDPLAPTQLGEISVPGTVNDVEVEGTIAYLAAKSGGVHVVDVSDPTSPTLLTTIQTFNSSVKVATSGDGYLSVANWGDTRVFNVTDPANPTIVGVARQTTPKAYAETEDENAERPDITARILATEMVGKYIWIGNWWYPYSYQMNAQYTAPVLYLPETVNYLGFPGDLAPGESASINLEARNDGNETLTIYDTWVDNPAFVVTPRQLQLAPGASGSFTVTFTASEGVTETIYTDPKLPPTISVEETGIVHFRSDDPMWPERLAYVVGNPPGIGIGDPMPETTATLTDETEWSYFANAKGDVTLLAYWATY